MTEGARAAADMAVALDRWTGEGGAAAGRTDAAPGPGRKRLLRRLGIATVEAGERLPVNVRRAIFHRAADDPGEPPATMPEMARVLRDSAGQRDTDGPPERSNNIFPKA